MREGRRKAFECNLSAVGEKRVGDATVKRAEMQWGMTGIDRKKYAQSSVTAVTDRNFFIGETSIVNIGSEGEYESSL
jgi:hypothetical protein